MSFRGFPAWRMRIGWCRRLDAGLQPLELGPSRVPGRCPGLQWDRAVGPDPWAQRIEGDGSKSFAKSARGRAPRRGSGRKRRLPQLAAGPPEAGGEVQPVAYRGEA